MGHTSVLHEYFGLLYLKLHLEVGEIKTKIYHATARRLHKLGAPYAVGCEIEAKWYDPRTWLSGVYEGDGSLCPLRVAHEAGHADVVAFLAELLPDVDPATGKRRTKEL